MHGERRRWRPTPRESTLSLSELIDASARTTTTGGPSSDRRQQKQKQRAPKEAKKKKEPKNQRHSGKNAPTATGDGVGRGASQCEFKVVVENMVALEDLEDPDERADVEKKLHAVLSRHGKLQSIEIDDATGAIVAAYADLEGARVTVSVLHGSEYESRSVSARLQSAGSSALAVGGGEESRAAATQVQAPAAEHDVPRKKSKRRSKLKSDVIRDRARRKQHQQNQQDGEKFVAFSLRSSTLVIRNLLDPEELEDDDEYADVYREAHGDLSEHGQLERLTIARRGPGKAANADVGSIVVNYEQAHTATKAFEFYNDKVFGGRRVTCEWVGRSVAVKVDGMLDPEELEDPDEYEDIKTEVSEYFAGYDQVSSVEIVRESGDCIVKCEHEAAASEFIRSVNGKKYGGHPLKVYLVQGQQFVDDVHKKSLIPTSRSTESTVEAPATQVGAARAILSVLIGRISDIELMFRARMRQVTRQLRQL